MQDVMNQDSRMQAGLALAGWLLLVFSASVPGVIISTGGWYAQLDKPSWNPPDWIFGPVWTVLYIMMAVAAWRVWLKGGWCAKKGPLSLFLVQLGINAAWTPVFFGLREPGWAFAAIVILFMFILMTLHAFRAADRTAAVLMVPYAAWVAFAGALNFTIWIMN